MTPEAQEELLRLEQESNHAREEANKYYRLDYKNEARSWDGKWCRLYNKLSEVQKLGISSNEKKAIIQSLSSMFTMNSSRDIGSSNFQKVGFINKLNSYVIVNGSKGSEYLRNVRGMSGEAG